MVDIEKLKALAVRAIPEAEWFEVENLARHSNIDKPAARFIKEASPTAVLELIAEVETLRADNTVMRERLLLVDFIHGPKAEQRWAALSAECGRRLAALERVRDQLMAAGATLPAPEPQGSTESAMRQGLCIALALVEQALPVLPAPALTSRVREKLQAMQVQQKPAGAAGGATHG